ncbi:hypothetical protein CEXT_335091 [Caerostris extrusa]|uniref:Secreted protein n=1 Tax=Caerostris extrusa TaxID=172846 RepID=A0AAV4P317_CAEEX|nr:hypothetical protein CEXT_335091 [Caerostris extrusa]
MFCLFIKVPFEPDLSLFIHICMLGATCSPQHTRTRPGAPLLESFLRCKLRGALRLASGMSSSSDGFLFEMTLPIVGC